ncbi:MAG: SEL1-like repeat protein [Magnetococcales bacterium]|nr:SEL1-like repeat protein [Magnetococcales bacterium]
MAEARVMARHVSRLLISGMMAMGMASTPAQTLHADSYQEALIDYQLGYFPEALARWKVLAEQGNAKAQFQVGEMLLLGEGVPKNTTQAIHYLTQAAKQGQERAALRLGILYTQGQGVAKDSGKAREWFSKAGALGTSHLASLQPAVVAKGAQGMREELQLQFVHEAPILEAPSPQSDSMSAPEPQKLPPSVETVQSVSSPPPVMEKSVASTLELVQETVEEGVETPIVESVAKESSEQVKETVAEAVVEPVSEAVEEVSETVEEEADDSASETVEEVVETVKEEVVEPATEMVAEVTPEPLPVTADAQSKEEVSAESIDEESAPEITAIPVQEVAETGVMEVDSEEPDLDLVEQESAVAMEMPDPGTPIAESPAVESVAVSDAPVESVMPATLESVEESGEDSTSDISKISQVSADPEAPSSPVVTTEISHNQTKIEQKQTESVPSTTEPGMQFGTVVDPLPDTATVLETIAVESIDSKRSEGADVKDDAPTAADLCRLCTVQVGAFRDRTIATKVAEEIEKKGFDVYGLRLKDRVGKPWWSLHIGRFTRRQDADALLTHFKETTKRNAFVFAVPGMVEDRWWQERGISLD